MRTAILAQTLPPDYYCLVSVVTSAWTWPPSTRLATGPLLVCSLWVYVLPETVVCVRVPSQFIGAPSVVVPLVVPPRGWCCSNSNTRASARTTAAMCGREPSLMHLPALC